ncbi:MAG: XRE family transcriptional regulator [Rectinemataceae bacterium]|nr:XRE family transcriptional regulator [Rectinemataceae bacterium]
MEYLVLTSPQLADALKSRRKVLGLTQRDVALRVGLLPKTVAALESIPERCAVDSLQRLMAALEFELVLRPKPGMDDSGRRPEW